MSMIIKIFRVLFFLALYFTLCMVAAVTFLKEWSPGLQMLFAFLTPIALVWWGEKRRARRSSSRQALDNEADSEQSESSSKRPSSPPPKSRSEKRVDQEREQIRQREISERLQPATGSTSKHTVPAESAHARSRTGQYNPPKQDYAAIVQAGRSSASELSEIAARKEAAKAKSPKAKATRRTGWVPSSDSVQIAGRDIGGMIFVGTPPRLNDYGYRDKCRAYIDPSLSVARGGTDKVGNYMPYWPSYSEIPAQCRATYLDWLESGRSDPTYDPGYMFLYFYGLERRFFLDKPPEAEKREILQEVRRLKNLYPNNGSVQRYLGEFIQLAQISLNNEALDEPIFEFRGWDIPLSLKVAIGARLKRGELLSAD
ncbi:TerB N-terminal domain-containing protein [Leisingera sp. F5]|uniref:TerB N-terminal domain-containing protein n=1 Tax=Leisingera sp. F5 TaxID=1813816 RepID=UPI000A614164|nr:TerB N-terminal domain-containing protein [Leisingera sp. F5]